MSTLIIPNYFLIIKKLLTECLTFPSYFFQYSVSHDDLTFVINLFCNINPSYEQLSSLLVLISPCTLGRLALTFNHNFRRQLKSRNYSHLLNFISIPLQQHFVELYDNSLLTPSEHSNLISLLHLEYYSIFNLIQRSIHLLPPFPNLMCDSNGSPTLYSQSYKDLSLYLHNSTLSSSPSDYSPTLFPQREAYTSSLVFVSDKSPDQCINSVYCFDELHLISILSSYNPSNISSLDLSHSPINPYTNLPFDPKVAHSLFSRYSQEIKLYKRYSIHTPSP